MRAKVHVIDWRFAVGARVIKPNGYPFPGVVVARFMTLSGNNERYVVEFTDILGEPTGLLHIFDWAQLEAAP